MFGIESVEKIKKYIPLNTNYGISIMERKKSDKSEGSR